jgi:hypothetical protein
LVTRHPTGRQFVGAENCGQCHKNAYAKWRETKHARAFKSLQVGRKGQEAGWISRIHDPECLCCHVTGWNPQEVQRYESGFLDELSTAYLTGQQCENCHGPGSVHSELETQWRADQSAVEQSALLSARQDVKLTVEAAKKSLCIQCHDLDNSPNFKFEKYWEEVRHPWKN